MTLLTMILTNILTMLVAVALILRSAAAQESETILTPGQAPPGRPKDDHGRPKHARGTPGDSKITQVEMKTKKDGTIMYEAHGIMADGKKLAILVAADGKLIKLENDYDDHPGAG
jgi:hypothetical protein